MKFLSVTQILYEYYYTEPLYSEHPRYSIFIKKSQNDLCCQDQKVKNFEMPKVSNSITVK